ncbi:helix-turn-helix domain-containing protein [Kitasatospora purpeofusca]|uniref:helix-turn-helix domain-containing protein n=1 Tax=Kitasatospora purpeofusca TaxID=67352 RepID=UPI00099CF201
MGRPKGFGPDVVVVRAMEAFRVGGYAGASAADLAEAIGVVEGGLHHSFGSGDELFTGAMDLYGRTGVGIGRGIPLVGRVDAAEECIRAHFVSLVDVEMDPDGPVWRGRPARNGVASRWCRPGRRRCSSGSPEGVGYRVRAAWLRPLARVERGDAGVLRVRRGGRVRRI